MDYETDDYKVRHYEGVRVIRFKHANLTGSMEVQRITDDIKGMITGGIRKLVVDFKHVEHCGSSALGMLLLLNKMMSEAKGKMVISHPENIMDLFTISRTKSMFVFSDDPKIGVKLIK